MGIFKFKKNGRLLQCPQWALDEAREMMHSIIPHKSDFLTSQQTLSSEMPLKSEFQGGNL